MRCSPSASVSPPYTLSPLPGALFAVDGLCEWNNYVTSGMFDVASMQQKSAAVLNANNKGHVLEIGRRRARLKSPLAAIEL